MPIITTDGQPIYYEDTGGNLPAVIFCHSFAMTGAMFAPQVEAFRDQYRCIIWDERAHGQSPAQGPFDFWTSARDAIAILDHLDIEKAAFAGVSQGGFVAMRAALLAPERVSALAVLGSSAAEEEPAQKEVSRAMSAAFAGDGSSGPPEEIIDALAAICFNNKPCAEPWKNHWRQWPAEQSAFAAEALIERDGISDRLREITAPALVMHGSDDRSFDPAHGQAIADGLGNCIDFIVVEGGAHFLSITEPEAFNTALTRLLRT